MKGKKTTVKKPKLGRLLKEIKLKRKKDNTLCSFYDKNEVDVILDHYQNSLVILQNIIHESVYDLELMCDTPNNPCYRTTEKKEIWCDACMLRRKLSIPLEKEPAKEFRAETINEENKMEEQPLAIEEARAETY